MEIISGKNIYQAAKFLFIFLNSYSATLHIKRSKNKNKNPTSPLTNMSIIKYVF